MVCCRKLQHEQRRSCFYGNNLRYRKNIANSRYIAAANPAAILELIRQRDELMAALKDARELVDDWGAYATAYMQEKHGLAEDLERLDAAISKVEEQS